MLGKELSRQRTLAKTSRVARTISKINNVRRRTSFGRFAERSKLWNVNGPTFLPGCLTFDTLWLRRQVLLKRSYPLLESCLKCIKTRGSGKVPSKKIYMG